MSYLTESYLRSYAHTSEGIINKSRFLKNNVKEASISVFLSHSHRDRDIVQGFISFLASYGIFLYVDWQDSNMPRITSRDTAEIIKKKIYELDYFLVLATRNALESKWVPWEIGIADAGKSLEKIAIVPVMNTNGNYPGNEYLTLYQRIEIAKSKELGLFPPNKHTGILLNNWLKPYYSKSVTFSAN